MDESTNAEPQHAPESPKKEENTLMATLAYIGPLILVPFLLAKENPFVKFHIKQGLLLVIIEVASWMVGLMFWPLFFLIQIINIFLLVLAVVGIIRAVRGEMKELPLIGHWAKNFTF